MTIVKWEHGKINVRGYSQERCSAERGAMPRGITVRRLNIDGLIRLDYFSLWSAGGSGSGAASRSPIPARRPSALASPT